MKKRGISLIVLIVTIIVIIILAAVVILTISKNNPIESAREAAFKEDVRTFQDELAMYIAKDYTNKSGARDEKITETDSSKIKDYIPSFSNKYEGKFVIKNDELMYSEGKLTEKEQIWSENLNVKENAKTGAEKAKEAPKNYYGAKVDYKTGNEDIDNDITEWKIFYSDGSNVYIISASYLNPNLLPFKIINPNTSDEKKVRPENKNVNASFPKATTFDTALVSIYNGSSDMLDQRIRALNSDYFKERIDNNGKKYIFESGNNYNMKYIAYMLDYEIWQDFSNKNVSEYAIGGTSVEMFFNSYNNLYNEKYASQALSNIGYQIRKSSNEEYTKNINGMINTSDSLYVLPSNSGANGMWLASPSIDHSSHIMFSHSNGSVSYSAAWETTMTHLGFRPLVCLNSNVSLNWNEQEQIYEIK